MQIEIESTIQPLTPKEKRVLEFIEVFIRENGFSPSFKEIKEHFGFASNNSVQNYLRQLQAKDYLSSPGGNQKRALRVLRSSQSHPQNLKQMQTAPSTSVPVPLMGLVAAGAPLEHLKHNESIDIPISLLKRPDMTYALQVQGNSMIDDGIHDGDTILVQKQNYADNGDIIVAVVNHEATVKRLYRSETDTKSVELRPANAEMSSFWYDAKLVDIRGIVVGLIRKY